MADDHERSTDRVLLVIVLAVAVLVPVAFASLEVSPTRITAGTVVVASLLAVGSVVLPALLFSRWETASRHAGKQK
ncbi:hypothetical protein EA462_12080 [Natrarchaeobius halalkaliphilus]|uniref:Uncharacterized protein n=1 Tax=Natrarchaeobius halalkaliphilus TaxID=1679091 RepID=A0A3N6LQ92_9EURY|nr:hypothetical protein [Natrarchaeobius halalkaliphilus]RQG89104.1 hypothetical protein EA462_12080 [Natrarchaeobius halalkaliphilus]